MDTDDRIPVTILTGFLGSGKTTLLNEIILHYNKKKIAVIENEFGEINIDSKLIVEADQHIFELSNGCLCCSLQGELLETIQLLLKKSDQIDHLIIETTGIADPGPVALSFLSNYEIQSQFRLDAIVTMVDCLFFEQQLERNPEVGKQTAIADLIVLNKTDKIDPYRLNVVKNVVEKINPNASIVERSFGKINILDILSLKAFSVNNDFCTHFEQTLKKQKQQRFSLDHLEVKPKSTFNNLTLSLKNHIEISSYSFEFSEPMDIVKFDLWISVMLNVNADRIYRIKGILNIKGSKQKMVFQSVHNQFLSASGGEWHTHEQRKTTLVIIGKNLLKEELSKGLKQCLYDGTFEGLELYQY